MGTLNDIWQKTVEGSAGQRKAYLEGRFLRERIAKKEGMYWKARSMEMGIITRIRVAIHCFLNPNYSHDIKGRVYKLQEKEPSVSPFAQRDQDTTVSSVLAAKIENNFSRASTPQSVDEMISKYQKTSQFMGENNQRKEVMSRDMDR